MSLKNSEFIVEIQETENDERRYCTNTVEFSVNPKKYNFQ